MELILMLLATVGTGAWIREDRKGEDVMADLDVTRRSIFKAMLAAPIGLFAEQQNIAPRTVGIRVGAGADRFGDVRRLPGGDLVYVKVATQDTNGAFYMTEQPIDRRGSGPPKHYHEAQDEWFYCLAGEYVFEIGDERFRLAAGESALAPRRVPHAFVYDAPGTGRLLVGFTPAGRMEQFFRDVEKRGQYFGAGTPEDKETARREYGIVNVGPPLSI
jgi:quercetin dioxygenase-like cupin family protein